MEQTQVVNVKVKYIRPKYKNLKEWISDPQNVYIGRKGVVFIDNERYPKKDSLWCNPYKITKDNNRKDVLEKYETYIRKKIKDENLYEELEKLRSKRLGCWCHPESCHGDILLRILNEFNSI